MKSTVEIRIGNGFIKGEKQDGSIAFKGIPFAAPPVGELRFKAPVPCEDWEGVLDCTKYGPRPVQVPPPWCMDRLEAVYDEDCLNLNVWTPAVDSGKRPVIFYLFGGGFMEGSNSELGSEGDRLIQIRDVVVVSPNYRVGALGALYLREIFGEEYRDSGNLTLLDQILALRWVRDNICFFGGDPEHVTIIGQSAGAKSVMQLMLAKDGEGLFHGAVAMSGSLQGVKDTVTMHNFARLFLKELRIDENDRKSIERISAEDILKAQEKMNQRFFKAETYGATADGIHLPQDVERAIREGKIADIPLIMGHTKEELFGSNGHMGIEEVEKKLYWKFGDNHKTVLCRYQEKLNVEDCQNVWGEIATDYTYRQAYMRTAEILANLGRKFWLYRWDYRGGAYANHSSDNEALFGRTNADKCAYDPVMTAKVDRYFQNVILNFAEFGNPSFGGEKSWRPYTTDYRERLLIDAVCSKEKLSFLYDDEFPLQVFCLRNLDASVKKE